MLANSGHPDDSFLAALVPQRLLHGYRCACTVFQGLSFGIIPGGFQEATLSKLGEDRVWMKNRKGLVKVRDGRVAFGLIARILLASGQLVLFS